jgi:hypothetical protein
MELPANHLRSISVSMQLIEKSVDELKRLFTYNSNGHSYSIVNDLEEEKINYILEITGQIKNKVKEFDEKYHFNKEVLYLSRTFNAIRAKLWEIICDTNSNRMKGYGKLEEETAMELDADTSQLLLMIERLYFED